MNEATRKNKQILKKIFVKIVYSSQIPIEHSSMRTPQTTNK
jgi:hypothetical protein